MSTTAWVKRVFVLLLIEISEVTLRFDREVKLPLYAANSIPEVWIIDLKKANIEVYSNPQNGVYQHRQIAKRSQSITPSLLTSLTLTVKEMLG